MKKRTIVALYALYAVSMLSGLPSALLRRAGLFRSRFVIGGREVERPEGFVTAPQREAFDAIGRVLERRSAEPLTEFTDWRLRADDRANERIPLGQWHNALLAFNRRGVILPRWQLVLRREGERFSPTWGPDGDSCTSRDAPPGPLTDVQKRAMFGTAYALFSTEETDDGRPQRYVTLSDEHFARIYARAPAAKAPKKHAATADIESLADEDDTHDVPRNGYVGVRGRGRNGTSARSAFGGVGIIDAPYAEAEEEED